jgi:hypothetical protein
VSRRRVATTAVACALALLGGLSSPSPVRAASPQGSPNDIEVQVAMLSSDLDELRHDVWTGVRINGYYAFEYHADNRGMSPTTFDQHSFNLFVGRNWEEWRVFGEIEYEHATDLEAEAGTARGKGAVKLEVGWFEYRHGDHLIIRGGKFFLPQYWNVNHYAPVVLSTTRPLMVRDVFPTDTVGLMAHGRLFGGDIGTAYTVYYANGQSDDATDDNENKAVGGRLVVHLAALSDHLSRLDLGVSGHTERSPAYGGALDVAGVDLQVNTVRYELLVEYASAECNPSMEGFYVQPSARLFGEVRGFYRYDYLDDGVNPETRHTAGLNWRPTANVSIKVEVISADFGNPGDDSFEELATSVALFF